MSRQAVHQGDVLALVFGRTHWFAALTAEDRHTMNLLVPLILILTIVNTIAWSWWLALPDMTGPIEPAPVTTITIPSAPPDIRM